MTLGVVEKNRRATTGSRAVRRRAGCMFAGVKKQWEDGREWMEVELRVRWREVFLAEQLVRSVDGCMEALPRKLFARDNDVSYMGLRTTAGRCCLAALLPRSLPAACHLPLCVSGCPAAFSSLESGWPTLPSCSSSLPPVYFWPGWSFQSPRSQNTTLLQTIHFRLNELALLPYTLLSIPLVSLSHSTLSISSPLFPSVPLLR